MTEIEQVRAKLAHLRAKLRASRPDGKEYYRLCLEGWERWLEKLAKDEDNDKQETTDCGT